MLLLLLLLLLLMVLSLGGWFWFADAASPHWLLLVAVELLSLQFCEGDCWA